MERWRHLMFESDSDSSDEDGPTFRPRWLRERAEYFEEYDDFDFAIRFRLSKSSALNLLTKIEDQLEFITERNRSITPLNQLLGTLRFYATNCTQLSMGDYSGWSKTSSNRIVHRVGAAIASLHTEYIKFPESPVDIRRTQEEFYAIARFPRVIGAMDCTHVRLSSVPLNFQIGEEEAEMFRNRKGYFSINVQTICNANLEITDIIARWPGSAHDSTIWNNCVRKAKFDSGVYGNALLVVDGGYAATSYCMPPLENPTTPAQQLYNESQIRTRNPVERQYGIWKRRFPILSMGMRVKLDKAMTHIIATAVLHNMLRQRGEGVPPDDPATNMAAPWEDLLQEGQIPSVASSSRPHFAQDALVSGYFQSLSN